jgi:hypothetical protein
LREILNDLLYQTVFELSFLKTHCDFDSLDDIFLNNKSDRCVAYDAEKDRKNSLTVDI